MHFARISISNGLVDITSPSPNWELIHIFCPLFFPSNIWNTYEGLLSESNFQENTNVATFLQFQNSHHIESIHRISWTGEGFFVSFGFSSPHHPTVFIFRRPWPWHSSLLLFLFAFLFNFVNSFVIRVSFFSDLLLSRPVLNEGFPFPFLIQQKIFFTDYVFPVGRKSKT